MLVTPGMSPLLGKSVIGKGVRLKLFQTCCLIRFRRQLKEKPGFFVADKRAVPEQQIANRQK